MYYAREGGYYESASACWGLLNFDCQEYQADIRDEILSYEGENLFQEFFPMLAYKTGDESLIDFMYELDSTTASTDCNGGLIIGIALYQERSAQVFDSLVFHPRWETYSTATGAVYSLYYGMRIQKYSLAKLYQNCKRALAGEKLFTDVHRPPRSLIDLVHQEGEWEVNHYRIFDLLHNMIARFMRDYSPEFIRMMRTAKFDYADVIQMLEGGGTEGVDDIDKLIKQYLHDDPDDYTRMIEKFTNLSQLLSLKLESQVYQDEITECIERVHIERTNNDNG